ncbi:MAG TPA: hypothetical protein VNC50_07095, partial [Planctomycetia bacterium]|nr:hypothetical protein [Planctomycetia bacterium]
LADRQQLFHPFDALAKVQKFRRIAVEDDGARPFRQRSEGMEKLLAIGEHCRAAGAAPVHLTGNHDPEISPIHSLDLCGGSVFVTHGDSLHPHVAPWSHDAPALKAEYDRLCALEGVPETWEDVCRVSKRVALVAANSDKRGRRGWLARGVMVGKFALEPWRAVNAVRYWAGVAGLSQGIQARHRPKARLMVIGHTHRPGIWKLPGFTLVNTGSYQPLSKPRAVRLTETEAQVFEVVRDGTVFRFGRELLRMSLVASENGSAAAH